MNFFELQDTARRNTGRLIFLFILAVISLIVITNILVMFVSIGLLSTSVMGGQFQNSFSWSSFGLISLAVLAVILCGSLYKMAALAGGGARVAEMLNGRLLQHGTVVVEERRVLNIVEEMALASGTPIPPVYLLEEEGINAFAAGYTPDDAVIGITRGAINVLTRDQLQGVIAHEFSHILHGDMRINIRLIAILHGILILGILGHYLLRGGAYSRRSKNSGGLAVLGLGLLAVGYMGTFFGNLIKAAVSRQREFLADASAVQFTRNPDGIGGALMRIAVYDSHSYLKSSSAVEISHALFEEGSRPLFQRLYATHPPLEKRIRAILPYWDGEYEKSLKLIDDKPPVSSNQNDQVEVNSPASQREKAAAVLAGMPGVLIADAIINQIGQPDANQVHQAKRIINDMPTVLLDYARTPSSARSVIYFLVLDPDAEDQLEQLRFLHHSVDSGVYAELEKLLSFSEKLAVEQRLPLIQISLNSLRQLSLPQYQLFKSNVDEMIKMDKKINTFEWALQKIVFKSLDLNFADKTPAISGQKDIKHERESLEILFSMLAASAARTPEESKRAFDKAGEYLGDFKLAMKVRSDFSLNKLNDALDVLAKLKPLQKPALLKACVACILSDKKADPIELELLRAIGATIDCPIPPVVIPV